MQQNSKPILVVMAAGMGSRYGGLKQIDPVGPHGEAILDYSLFDARRAGFETVVFIIKPEIDQAFRESVGARAEAAGLAVRYAYQTLDKLPAGFAVPEGRVKPWGTAHAVLAAAEAIDAPFAVINADDYYGPTGFRLIYEHLSRAAAPGTPAPWAMVGFLLGNTVSENGSVSRGVCELDERSRLVRVTERTRIEKRDGGIAYTGCLFADNDVAVHYNTNQINMFNSVCPDNAFLRNGTGLLIEGVPAGDDLGLPGCRFEGNGTDIDNRSGQPLDLSQASFQ